MSEDMAALADKLIQPGLDNQEIESRLAEYDKPANSKNLTKMKVNPEFWLSLHAGARARDVGFEALQSDLAAGMTAVARLADGLKGNKDLLATSMDALAILGHVHKSLSIKRREFLKAEVSDQGRQVFAVTQPADGLLFGENLGQKLKEIAEGNFVTRRLHGGGGPVPRFRPRGIARGRPPYPKRVASSGRTPFLGRGCPLRGRGGMWSPQRSLHW